MHNGFLICRGHCHQLLHEKKWTVTGNANTTLNFHDPTGITQHTSQPKQPTKRQPTRHARKHKQERDRIMQRVNTMRNDLANQTKP